MSLHDDGRHRRSVPSLGEWAATGIGFVIALVGVMYVVASPEPFRLWWIELAAAGALPAVLMYGGYWLASNDFDQTEVYTVAQGWFVGVVALSVVGGWAIMSAQPGEQIVVESLFQLVSVASAGAVLGLAFGLHTTRLTEELQYDADEATASDADATALNRDATADAAATDAPSRIDALLDDRSIADERRRDVVRALAGRDENAVDLRRLAADLESEWSARDGATITTELHHRHLPKLDDAGVLDYDPDTTTVQFVERR